VSCAIIILISR